MQIEQETLRALAAASADGDGPAIPVKSRAGSAYLSVTAVNGTTPTLDVNIEEFDPATGTWHVLASFAQLADAIGKERIEVDRIDGAEIREQHVIGGSAGQEFTFAVGFQGKEPDST